MNQQRFDQVVDDQLEKCKAVLMKKAHHRTIEGDRLAHFKIVAKKKGSHPAQACASMMDKHSGQLDIMLRDPVPAYDSAWDEVITDFINYLLLLMAILEEERESE